MTNLIKTWLRGRREKVTTGMQRKGSEPETGRPLYLYSFTDNSGKYTEINLIHIYTDAAGRNWYEFQGPSQMTAERHIAALVAEQGFFWNITAPDLYNRYTDALNDLDAGKNADVAISIGDLRTRLMKLGDYECILELSSIYYIIDGEHPGLFTDSKKSEKLKILKEDDAARAFFLKYTVDFLKPYAEISTEDLLSSLSGAKPVQKEPPQVKKKNTGTYARPKLSKMPKKKRT